MTRPSELRDAKIESIFQSGEDEVAVEIENGNYTKLDIEDLIKDWLHLHSMLQLVKTCSRLGYTK